MSQDRWYKVHVQYSDDIIKMLPFGGILFVLAGGGVPSVLKGRYALSPRQDLGQHFVQDQ